MRRGMELIRLLLLEAEGDEPAELSKYSEEQQIYHAAQLIDAGLLRGHPRRDKDGELVGVIIMDLTWAGHDFLASARSTGTWTKAMSKLKAVGVDVPLSVMKALLEHYAKELLGMKE